MLPDQTDLDIRVLVGRADACELVSALLQFPERALVNGLVDGSVMSDAQSCLADMGAREQHGDAVSQALGQFVGLDADDLFDRLRKGSSILFFSPGGEVPVWPYESAFLHVAEGREGMPTLFRSPVTLDVERMMRESGVRHSDDRTMPADSVWRELDYVSHCYAQAANGLYRGDADAAETWVGNARAFVRRHLASWLPKFFDMLTGPESSKHSFGREYAPIAAAARAILAPVLELEGE